MKKDKIIKFFSNKYNILGIASVIFFIFSLFLVSFSLIKSYLGSRNHDVYVYEDGAKYLEIENGYIINELILESGSVLPSIKDYFNPDYKLNNDVSIKYFNMNNEELNIEDFTVKINDTYFVKGIQDIIVAITLNGKDYFASVSIQDTTTPEVTIKDLTINQGENVNPKDFIVSYLDNSSIDTYNVEFIDNVDFSNPGEYKVKIKTCDTADNCTTVETKLNVIEKVVVIDKKESNSGTSTKQSVSKNNNKNSNKDYNSNNVNNENKTTKSTDPNFWAMVDNAKAYIENPANQEQLNFLYQTFLNETNDARNEVGVDSLVLDPTLCILAQVRILEYESLGWDESDIYVHKRPDLRDFSTIFKDYGFVPDVYNNQRHYGENYVSILGGEYYNNNGAFTLLYESPGHYANIVAPYYSKMGIGKGFDKTTGRLFWIQIFSS